MKYSSLTSRIQPDPTVENDPWAIHDLASERADAGQDIVMLSIGQEVDEVTPEIIVNTAIKSLSNGEHHYTDVHGTPELRECIAQYHEKLTGQKCVAANCTAVAGAQNGLFATAQVLLETGDEVIVSEPYYTTYAATFSATGATIVSIPVTRKNKFQLSPSQIENAISAKTQAIVLNSPNNPMGTCYSSDDFKAIVALCIKYDIWLIIDAVYLAIVDIDHSDLPHAIPGAENILITVCSLSKSHRMTGWRMGWVVAPVEVSKHLSNLSMCMHYGLPPFIMKAAMTAMNESTATPKLVQELISRRRNLASPILGKLRGAKLYDTGRGMFMLIDVSGLGINAFTFSLRLLNDYNVSVLPCDGFGEAGNKLVRVGLCVDDEKLELACNKIVACAEMFHTLNG